MLKSVIAGSYGCCMFSFLKMILLHLFIRGGGGMYHGVVTEVRGQLGGLSCLRFVCVCVSGLNLG